MAAAPATDQVRDRCRAGRIELGPIGTSRGQGRGVPLPRRFYYSRFGFWTRPALMHEVQTSIRRVEPFTTARTRWMLGFQRRRVRDLTRRLMALVPSRRTALPKLGCFPQISQTDPTVTPLDCRTVGAARRGPNAPSSHQLPHRQTITSTSHPLPSTLRKPSLPSKRISEATSVVRA